MITLQELNLVMADETPDSFDKLIEEMCNRFPEKEGDIKASVSESSFGKIYPSYYSSTDSLATVTDNVSEHLSETFSNLNPTQILSSDNKSNTRKLMATIGRSTSWSSCRISPLELSALLLESLPALS